MNLKLLALITALGGANLHAQTVDVTDAWVRATVPGQLGTGAFMKISARHGAKLVGAATPAAGVAEVHEMKLDGGIMSMRQVQVLDLPAGKVVELKPGGYHLMLMDLKAALPKGSTITLTLHVKDAKGVPSAVELKVPVAISAAAAKGR